MSKSPRNAFRLTATEQKIITWVQEGRSYKEIQKLLGYPETGNCRLGIMMSAAIEKHRLMLLDDRKPDVRTSLSRAHGVKRMQGTK